MRYFALHTSRNHAVREKHKGDLKVEIALSII
jgi:hypothetical protein